jgi:hypothetical protein
MLSDLVLTAITGGLHAVIAGMETTSTAWLKEGYGIRGLGITGISDNSSRYERTMRLAFERAASGEQSTAQFVASPTTMAVWLLVTLLPGRNSRQPGHSHTRR